MKIKTYLLAGLIAAGSVGASNVALAQAPDSARHHHMMLTPEQRIEKRLAHAKKKLGLSDDQVAKLKAILEQNEAQLKADREAMRSAAPGTDAKKDARQKLLADTKSIREQLKGVLTPDQLKKWKEMKMEQIDRREQRLEKRKEMLKK